VNTPDHERLVGTNQSTTLHDDIISLLLEHGAFPNDAQEFRLPLQAVQSVTPEVLPLNLRYMTTGSDLARTATARSFGLILLGINKNKLETTKSWHTHVDVYRELLDYYEGLSLVEQTTLGWHFNNVASEMGMNLIEVDATIHYVVQNCTFGIPEDENPDVYWRGVSALHIACRDITSYPNVNRHLDFIREAGSSDDMASLITLAHERNILSVAELRAILKKQASIVSGIQDGVL
jgi:hypothetical protein